MNSIQDPHPSRYSLFPDVEALATDPGVYGLLSKFCALYSFFLIFIGSYVGAGHLLSSINTTGPVTNYARWLDIDQSLARTSWTQNGDNILRYHGFIFIFRVSDRTLVVLLSARTLLRPVSSTSSLIPKLPSQQ